MARQRVLGEMDREEFMNHINGVTPAI